LATGRFAARDPSAIRLDEDGLGSREVQAHVPDSASSENMAGRERDMGVVEASRARAAPASDVAV